MNWKELPWIKIKIKGSRRYTIFEQAHPWGTIWVTYDDLKDRWSGTIEHENYYQFVHGGRIDLPSVMDGIQEFLDEIGVI